MTHPDIWERIAWHVRRRQHGDIRIFKVKAHQVDDISNFGIEQWKEFANKCADENAKAVFSEECCDLYNEMKHLVQKQEDTEHSMQQYHSYLCDIADRYFEISKRNTPDTALMPNFAEIQPQVWPLGSFPISAKHVQAWPFGDIFAERFCKWWNNLKWNNEGIISYLELYFDFAIASGSLVPVNLSKNQWVLRDQNIHKLMRAV